MITIHSFLHILLVSLTLLFTPTQADVAVSKPLMGATYDASGGSAKVTIQWIESNSTPKLPDISSYVFTVCTGPNSNIHAFDTGKVDEVTRDDLGGTYQYTVSIENTIGSNGYYYIQIYAVNPDGTTIHYTNRFQLTGMIGTYQPSVGVVTAPPDPQTALAGADKTVLSLDPASFTVPYTMQTGTVRYAPMQTQPATQVTKGKSDWTRRYATSAVTYYTSTSTSLDQLTTYTPGWNYQWTSVANWATPAAFPSANGGWYNPSDRLKLRIPTLRSTNDVASSMVASKTAA